MVIHNASFMMERDREREFVDWIKGELFDMGLDCGTTLLSAMREAGGVDYRDAEAQTVALQVEFDTVPEALEWRETGFMRLAEGFAAKFGPEAMVFTSVFEKM